MEIEFKNSKRTFRNNNCYIPEDSILRRIKFFFSALQSNVDNYMFVTDLKYNIVMLSTNLYRDFGLPGEIFEDMDKYWQPLIHPDDLKLYQDSINNMIATDKITDKNSSHDIMYRVRNVSGDYVWLNCRGNISYNKRSGQPLMFIGSITKLSNMNHADPVTGLLNKKSFENTVQNALHCYHRNGNGGGIMIFGLDNFKLINESYNRTAGDNLLRNVAKLMKGNLSNGELLYKLDGDEFAVVSPGMTEADADNLFARIQQALHTIKEIDGHGIFCTISAGTVCYPQGGKDLLVLYKHVEAALDLAKQDGKNRNCIFTCDRYNRWLRSRSIREDIRICVEDNFKNFQLYFQPQVSAKDGSLIGAEALLRWSNLKGRMVSPMEFIPILEETKLIIPVGFWVMETAIKQCKKWQEYIPDFKISINLSYEQMKDSTLHNFFIDCLKKYNLSAQSVVLELTETSIMSEWPAINREFNKMRNIGVKIAIDDFGTGSSSLACLRTLACDVVKIDRAFVIGLQDNTFNQRLFKYTVDLCHSIGIVCCVEGVEQNAEYEMLTKICDAEYIQGYLFGRPENEANFVEKFLNGMERL